MSDPAWLYTAEQTRALDRAAIEDHGIPGYTLMTRAGEALYRRARDRWPLARRWLVVCGPGNNGGDGYVIARLAHQAGYPVRVLQVGGGDKLQGDARTARDDLLACGVTPEPFARERVAGHDLIIDALLGTGLERPVAGEWAAAVERINADPAPIVAVDVPSGLHSDRGTVLGTAVEAAMTVTFIGRKRGLYTGQGPDLAGRVVFDGLQVPDRVYQQVPADVRLLTGPAPGPLAMPRRRSAHKGDFGHVLVIGGDLGYAGAARMAGEAAARAGAGLVTLATRREHAAQIVAGRPELMVHGVEEPDELKPLLARATVVVVGPGLGQGDWGRSLWHAAHGVPRPKVVDADALNLLAQEPGHREDWILTPHPGEAARLLECDRADITGDRFAAVEALQKRYGGTVILKGAGTLVAGPVGRPALCGLGNPGMASGGMGDVLSGVIAALRAQGLNDEVAAETGVCVHAAAADLAAMDGERGMLAGDVIGCLRRVLNGMTT